MPHRTHYRRSQVAVMPSWIACAAWAVLLLIPVHASAATFPPADPRTTLDLDASWKFNRDNTNGVLSAADGYNDSTWGAVMLPHTWNNLDGEDCGLGMGAALALIGLLLVLRLRTRGADKDR
jgi:hypothetical protein